jgi:hypothetical protein
MALVLMFPPANGANTTITFDGRTYSSTPGSAIQVPDFDAAVLAANGWTQGIDTAKIPNLTSNYALNTVLPNNGLQIVSDRPCNQFNQIAAPVTLNTIISDPCAGTSRIRHRAGFAATHLVLVFGNFQYPQGGTYAPGPNGFHIRCSLLQKFGSSYNDQSNSKVPVYFNGKRFGQCEPGGLLFSDPIPFAVAAQEIFFSYNAFYLGGPNWKIPHNMSSMGNTAPGSGNIGEGFNNGDVSDSGTVAIGAMSYLIAPITILGFSPTNQPTVAILGDSIAGGSTDAGGYSTQGGFLHRMCAGHTGLVPVGINGTPDATPMNFPFINLAHGGESLANILTLSLSSSRLALAELASTIVSEYGTNDVAGGTTLATMQANYLALASKFMNRGKKFIQCTILPRVTSTDNMATLANQTPLASESVRVAVNSWLRDPSPAGFIQQAVAAAISSNISYVDVLDVAAIIEVNSSGSLSINGGLCLSPETLRS